MIPVRLKGETSLRAIARIPPDKFRESARCRSRRRAKRGTGYEHRERQRIRRTVNA